MKTASAAHRAFIGLGANLASPRQQVLAAFAALDETPGVRVLRRSSLYVSGPVGYLDQPDFINAVALIETTLAPHALLVALMEIERQAGRVRGERFGPRVLDIDLLLFDECVIEGPALTVPHPRMHERSFVLQPLFEIAPETSIPGRGRVADLLPALADQRCEKMDDSGRRIEAP